MGTQYREKIFNFLPLIYYTNYKIKEDYSFTFFPLYHQSRTTGLNSQMFSHYSPFLFWEKEKFSDSEWESSFYLYFCFINQNCSFLERKPLVYFLLH
ncbi:hypothetical protein LEP1GSC037_1509 [Leptospira interrogans str. 2006001854]|uniref:Uncharacterized protein n=1 Tax=Leptospira interrogans str. 2006001854 TaxID=1001590 RepID=M6G560_LEPIR|nr:hypothetical protein LEP1GSC037_1509 [Leptospira interrogans str. 2006001854]